MDEQECTKIINDNYKKVKTWPKWKQKIVISSDTTITGRFIRK